MTDSYGYSQAAEWADWERMLLSDTSEPSPLLSAFHVLCTQLLLVELLAPATAKAGGHFCSSLGENTEKHLAGLTINAYTWPELLRIILIARSVAQAPKKRAVALTAMLSHGCANANVAAAASAAVGGGHAVSVWSVASTSAVGEGEDEGEVEGEGDFEHEGGTLNGDWSAITDALGATSEYCELSLSVRCTIIECLAQASPPPLPPSTSSPPPTFTHRLSLSPPIPPRHPLNQQPPVSSSLRSTRFPLPSRQPPRPPPTASM